MSRIFIVFFLLGFSFYTEANKKLPVPRFVTIKFNEVNARTGPAIDCPIEWVFTQKGEPVEVVAEYGQWRKVRDIENEGGWIHSSALGNKRSVVIFSRAVVPLLAKPEHGATIIAQAAPSLRCSLKKCSGNWCNIICQSYKGWVEKKNLWGVYKDE